MRHYEALKITNGVYLKGELGPVGDVITWRCEGTAGPRELG